MKKSNEIEVISPVSGRELLTLGKLKSIPPPVITCVPQQMGAQLSHAVTRDDHVKWAFALDDPFDDYWLPAITYPGDLVSMACLEEAQTINRKAMISWLNWTHRFALIVDEIGGELEVVSLSSVCTSISLMAKEAGYTTKTRGVAIEVLFLGNQNGRLVNPRM